MDKLLIQSTSSRKQKNPEVYYFFLFILVCVFFLVFSFFLAPGAQARAAENTSTNKPQVVTINHLLDSGKNYISFTPSIVRILKNDQEEVHLAYLTSFKVKDILKELHINTQDYKVVPPEDQYLVPPYIIKMIKLETRIISDTKEIQYDTEIVFNNSMYDFEERELQAGINGEQIVTSRNYYEDGMFVKKEILNTEITKQPITRIIHKGTKIYFETNSNPNLEKWANYIDTVTTDENERFWLKVTMKCESMGRENVSDPSGRFHGLFQYDPITWSSHCDQYTDDVFNGEAQVKCTLDLYRAGYQKKWPVCGN